MNSPQLINAVCLALTAMSRAPLAFCRPRAGELAAMVVAAYVAALSAQQVTASYDAFMLRDANERLETSQTLTPDNRAALLREQLARWRQVHASRLTPQQEQVLTEVAGFIQPDMFTTTRRPPVRSKPTWPSRGESRRRSLERTRAKRSLSRAGTSHRSERASPSHRDALVAGVRSNTLRRPSCFGARRSAEFRGSIGNSVHLMPGELPAASFVCRSSDKRRARRRSEEP